MRAITRAEYDRRRRFRLRPCQRAERRPAVRRARSAQAVKWRLAERSNSSTPTPASRSCDSARRRNSSDKPTVTEHRTTAAARRRRPPRRPRSVRGGRTLLADASVHGALTDGTTVERARQARQPRLGRAAARHRRALQPGARSAAAGRQGARRALAPLPARSLKLDDSSFPQYGRRPWTSPSTSTSTCRWWRSSCCPSATVMTPRRRPCWRSRR